MPEALLWDADIRYFDALFNGEDDKYLIIVPIDQDGQPQEDLALALNSNIATTVIQELAALAREMLQHRRNARRAKEHGVDPEVYESRIIGQQVADDVDEAIRELAGNSLD